MVTSASARETTASVRATAASAFCRVWSMSSIRVFGAGQQPLGVGDQRDEAGYGGQQLLDGAGAAFEDGQQVAGTGHGQAHPVTVAAGRARPAR